MRKIDILALVLLIIGGINWGLWGIFDFNLVDYIFGKVWIDRVIYFVIGIAAIYVLVAWKSVFLRWKKSK